MVKSFTVYAIVMKRNKPISGLEKGDILEVYLYKRTAELMCDKRFHTIKKYEVIVK